MRCWELNSRRRDSRVLIVPLLKPLVHGGSGAGRLFWGTSVNHDTRSSCVVNSRLVGFADAFTSRAFRSTSTSVPVLVPVRLGWPVSTAETHRAKLPTEGLIADLGGMPFPALVFLGQLCPSLHRHGNDRAQDRGDLPALRHRGRSNAARRWGQPGAPLK